MTREEAIKWLNYSKQGETGKAIEALETAIQALSQEPCEDAISRQAAIDAMCELMRHWFGGDPKDEIREIKRELEKLPFVQPDYITEVSKMDCISRQAAKLKVARVIWEDGDSCYDFHDKCVDCLDDVPSSQPEIIRCKDCKYWREHKYAKETKKYIPFCGFNAIYTKSDDFCSRAERRENDKR